MTLLLSCIYGLRTKHTSQKQPLLNNCKLESQQIYEHVEFTAQILDKKASERPNIQGNS